MGHHHLALDVFTVNRSPRSVHRSKEPSLGTEGMLRACAFGEHLQYLRPVLFIEGHIGGPDNLLSSKAIPWATLASRIVGRRGTHYYTCTDGHDVPVQVLHSGLPVGLFDVTGAAPYSRRHKELDILGLRRGNTDVVTPWQDAKF